MIKLTQLETQIVKTLIDQLYAEPGFSDVDAYDISELADIPTKAVRGALGSLSQKGIIHIDSTETFGSKSYQLIYLSSDHWYLHPQWKNEREWQPEEIMVVPGLEDTALRRPDLHGSGFFVFALS